MHPSVNVVNTSLFIGDLPKFCAENDLRQLFSPFGPIVEIKIKRNSNTGKTLSYGFVTFASEVAAQEALSQLDGILFLGRKLRLRWAMYNARVGNPVQPTSNIINSVYVRFVTSKMDRYVTEEDLHYVFGGFGSVADVSIKESSIDQRLSRQSGYGFVHFSSDQAGVEAAFLAVQTMDNAVVDGVTYNVELSKNLLKQFSPNGEARAAPQLPNPPTLEHNINVGAPLMTTAAPAGLGLMYPQDPMPPASYGSFRGVPNPNMNLGLYPQQVGIADGRANYGLDLSPRSMMMPPQVPLPPRAPTNVGSELYRQMAPGALGMVSYGPPSRSSSFSSSSYTMSTPQNRFLSSRSGSSGSLPVYSSAGPSPGTASTVSYDNKMHNRHFFASRSASNHQIQGAGVAVNSGLLVSNSDSFYMTSPDMNMVPQDRKFSRGDSVYSVHSDADTEIALQSQQPENIATVAPLATDSEDYLLSSATDPNFSFFLSTTKTAGVTVTTTNNGTATMDDIITNDNDYEVPSHKQVNVDSVVTSLDQLNLTPPIVSNNNNSN